MLQLIFGPVRSGKTEAVFDCVRADNAAGRRAILLVPEQTSFTYEKRAAALGLPDVEALSFSRLAELVLAQHGGDKRRRLTGAAGCFLMSLALDDVKDMLTLYKKQADTRGFLRELVGIAAECADAGVTPQMLSNFSSSQPQGLLRDKTADLALILDAYTAVMHREHISGADVLTLAAQCLDGTADFADACIYVESFASFTAPEYRLLEALLPQAHSVTVSLIGDGKTPTAPAYETTLATANRLRRIAAAHDIEVSQRVLGETKSNIPPQLLAAVRDGDIPQTADISGSVTTYLAADPAAECDYVAAQCARLVYGQGCRCRDIAIVMRDDTRYRTLLNAALTRCALPFFSDMRANDRSAVLLRGVIDAVLTAAGDRRGSFLAVMKSPLLGLDAAAVGEVENYSLVWSVRAGEWFMPFTNNPDGMRESFTDEQTERLGRIESCRAAVAAPLLRLRDAVRSESGLEFARGLYWYLRDIAATEHLEAFAEGMPESARRTFLQQQSQLWDQLTDVLDLFANVPEGIALPPARITELLEMAISAIEVATPPQTLDEITVGTADRMRIDDAKAVFVMGAVQGEFPRISIPTGLLSDDDRRVLVANGMPLLSDFDSGVHQEQLIACAAVSSAGERLFVTAPAAELDGTALTPSEIFDAAAKFSAPCDYDIYDSIVTPACALRAYAACTAGSVQAATVRRALEIAGCADKAEKIDLAVHKTPHRIESAPLARRLFGQRMSLSPSRLEKYYRCPYSYFVSSGLHVQALRRAELSPIESGTLIHRVLERMVSEYGGKGLATADEGALRARIQAEIDDYFNRVVADKASVTERMRASFQRMGEWLYELLRRLGDEFMQSEFEPVAFEMPVGDGGDVDGMRLETADGCEIYVHGTVDRVDTATINGRKYVRVVDYKSGKKVFALRDIYYGLNLQMLIYLFSIWKNGHNEFADVLPAGVLYMPALGKYTNGARGDGDAPDAAHMRQYRMNGLLLNDPAVLHAMETDGEGVFIPVKAGKESDESLATLSELGRLCTLVEQRVRDVASQLCTGGIAACPTDGAASPCGYCDYRSICGFEPGDAVRQMPDIDREAIFGKEDDDHDADA